MNFLTYLNVTYLPYFEIQLESLRQHRIHKKVFVICVDELSFDFLKLAGNDVIPIALSDIECTRLKSARSNRNFVEYLWTLTPFCISYVLENHVPVCTYIDADTEFTKFPNEIFKTILEHPNRVMLTPHYFDHYKQRLSGQHGQFCVQFMNFHRNKHQPILEYWKDSVISKCSSSAIDGYYGDQKYVEQFPELFNDLIFVNENENLFGGPWNANSISFTETELFHFHGFRFITDTSFQIYDWSYKIYDSKVASNYFNYAQKFINAVYRLKEHGFDEDMFIRGRTCKERLKAFVSRNTITLN